MYDSRIGRWISRDPKNQFWSPYVGMGNNPASGVDPDGAEFERLRAQWYALWHGGRVQKLSNGYSVVKWEDGQVKSKVFKYGWEIPGRLIFKPSVRITAGAQVEAKFNVGKGLLGNGVGGTANINAGRIDLLFAEADLTQLDKSTFTRVGAWRWA